MKVAYTVKDLRDWLAESKKSGGTIGFVPTMGYLHDGHASLFYKAKETADIVVASVFVNPTQFGPNEDFETYPRDFEHDLRIAESCGVDIVFHPDVSEIYSDSDMIQLKVTDRADVLCGKSRPGHFDGVVTVLTRLFHIVQPDYAFFGKKDAQQLAIVQGLIQTLHFPIRLIPCETVREADGLAKSSRNVRLSVEERKEAVHLYQSLTLGRHLIEKGERDAERIRQAVMAHLEEHLKLGRIDYVEVLSYPQLKVIESINDTVIIALAVFYANARLIDNVIIEIPS
ncbi:pantoate--beta-alanine ligase [Tuberibacillus calidus]|uniref:pantoate--beta-alanine ligase n=1 Tax=Tuberibacillus calidus TaxID=340097 RepID=UPI0003FC09B5|nr:pantoate--beta-alanine ligase [Tuberibacillus calidus]